MIESGTLDVHWRGWCFERPFYSTSSSIKFAVKSLKEMGSTFSMLFYDIKIYGFLFSKDNTVNTNPDL